jgi:hypothetical protein
MEGNMATINTKGSGNQSFKQIEGDTWSSIYLPAICACILMTIVLFLAVSCSKKSDNAAKISAPSAPAATNPVPSTTSAAVPEQPKKATKKHRPANATYVNGTYGVSFSYPRKYSLQTGNKNSQVPIPASFLKPGIVEVASVDMPDDSYPDTDFSSALLNVSVNTDMTAEECAQFIASEKAGNPEKPTSMKLGSNEFTALEQISGEPAHQSDLKYFHLFKNGACYEFALAVETSRKADEELAQVDRGKVFQKLEKILTTAKIKDVEVPGVEKAQKPTEAPTTAFAAQADDKTEKAQVVTPAEQK